MSHYFQSPTARSTPFPTTTTAPNSSHVQKPGLVNCFEQKIKGLFKDTFSIFQGPHSVQKRVLSLCLFQFFHNINNFILKVFLCLFLLSTWESGLDKVTTKIERTFQHRLQFSSSSKGLAWINFYFKIQGHSRTFKVHAFAYQATSLTKFGFREIPAAASKTEE